MPFPFLALLILWELVSHITSPPLKPPGSEFCILDCILIDVGLTQWKSHHRTD